MQKITSATNQIIYIVYLATAVITPLLFTTKTTEIYEVPKMFFVYLAATIILFATLLKFTLEKMVALPTNIPTLAFGFFLLTQVASTITSTDKYTSVFGYPTRLNGGLLSIISYFVLFTGATINLNAEKAKNIILAMVFTAVAVSIWGIPSHFDRDPTCYILTGELTSGCWQKEFNPTLRIFSTFGQPNWLASYMVLSLPVALSLALTFKGHSQLIMAGSTILIFWSLILTNSRSGLLGMAASLIILTTLLGTKNLKANFKLLLVLFAAFVIISFSFADTIKSRIADTLRNSAPVINQTENVPSTQSSLASGGTESGQIRLIVWQGAISIFKKWPVLGLGPETFVSSYYLFRPSAQNQTSEWEFFYNKAHNEFLNYLATTGLLGFTAYLFLCLSILYSISKSKKTDMSLNNLQKGTIAAIFGYFATIFFGFSTVATQTTFIILSAMTLIVSGNSKTRNFNVRYLSIGIYYKIQVVLVTILFTYSLTLVARIYFSDILAARGQNSQGSKALLIYKNAITIAPAKNPYLLAEFAYELGLYANSTQSQANKKLFASELETTADTALGLAPNNYLVHQKIVKSFTSIGADGIEIQKARNIADKLTALAPTYPPAYLTQAQFYVSVGEFEKASQITTSLLNLKPDYLEAQKLRDELTIGR